MLWLELPLHYRASDETRLEPALYYLNALSVSLLNAAIAR